MSRPRLIPDEKHPITVTPTPGRVRVVSGDTVVAETSAGLTLREEGYPPVQYVPISDIEPAVLKRSDTTSYCPFKGDASYYSVQTPDGTIQDAGWTYEEPYDAVAHIRGYVAFYADNVTVAVGD